jgi:hypothetical protein
MDVSVIKKVLVLVVALTFFSCGKKEKRPENIMSKEEMISILIDIRRAEGMVSTLSLNNDSTTVLFKELEKDIFLKHSVDSAFYTESYQYYLLKPNEALYITDAVIDSLKTMKDIRENQSKKNRKDPTKTDK